MTSAIGLYVPGGSPVHRLPAGIKLALLAFLAVVATVPPPNVWLLGGLASLVLLLYLAAGLGLSRLWQQLWGIRWLILFVLVPQIVFLALPLACVNAGRMVLVILLAALVTLTTRMRDTLAAVERGLGPLRRMGVDPTRLSLVLAMTIRTVPIISDFAEQLRDAQRARGIRFHLRAFIVSLLVRSLRQADDLADALAARGVDD